MIKLTGILPETENKAKSFHLLITVLFLTLFAFPLFPLKITNIIFMLVAALTLTAFFIKPFNIGKTLLKNLIFVVPFIPYLAELFISQFDPSVRFEFEKKIFFFSAPLIIPVFIKVTGFRNYKLALVVFSLSVTILTIYTIAVFLSKGVFFLATTYENGAFILRDNFEKISGLHPTYLSIFALLASCFLFYASFSEKKALRVSYIIFSIILITTVLFIAVKIAFVTLVIFLLFRIINSKLTKLRKIILGFCVLFFLVLISFSVPSLKNRFSEMVSRPAAQIHDGNTVSQRLIIMDCSYKIFSENIFFGTGSGNFQKKLNDCYCSKGWQQNDKNNFNPHNQFLSIGINYGIFIMLVFIVCLFIMFRKIFKIPEGKYFVLAIIMYFLSESMLERQMGVYLFGLISLLLYNVNDSKVSAH